jgi:spermidine synthase
LASIHFGGFLTPLRFVRNDIEENGSSRIGGLPRQEKSGSMKKRIRIAILAMGFSGLAAEILLLRELLIVFSGNELCIGIILANWLILEAFGSFYLGRKAEQFKDELETFTIITILFSLSLFIAVFLTRVLKRAMGISIGESIGFLPMFYSSFLILLPVGILHGALFTVSCRIYSMYSSQDASSVGWVYAYETMGTIIGGIVSTYLLVPYLNSFQASSWLALLNFIVCLVLLAPYWKTGLYQKTILAILSVLIWFSGYLVFAGQADKLHRYSVRAQWKNQNVVHYQNSPYGNICIIENQGQYIFFQDGVPNIITPIPDMPFIEEFVHLPLLAHPEPRKLLILSGGAGGVINEALKHSLIETIEYAELDPLLLDLFRRFPTPLTESELNDKRVKIKHIDGRLFVKTTRNTYDVILVGIMEPSSLQSNRFFTREFFSLVKTRLNEGGIFVLGLPGSLTYSNQELKNLNSCIFSTLKSVFSYVRVIPGDGTNLFLSSESGEILTIGRMQILERLNSRNIKADVIVPWYIEGKLHPGWQDWFSSFIEGSSQKINSDLNPVGLFYSISHWNALFAPSLRWLFRQFERTSLRAMVLLFVIFLLLYSFLRSKNIRFLRAGIPLSIVTTGFAGMIFDLMLIFTFQSIYGYVFSWIGLLVASFMAGAACGAMLITRVLARIKNSLRLFIQIDLAIVCFSIGCLFMFLAVHKYLGSPSALYFRMLFLVVSFVCGLLIGSQFPLAIQIYLRSSTGLSQTAGLLYASDLLGGWLGGIIGAVVLLPVLGLVGTCITVGLLKLTSFIVLTTSPIGIFEET